MVFTTLAHHMDEAFLTEALHQLRKDAAAGIDRMTVAEYSQNLKENIADLHQRLVNRKYRAQPARRVWIPKSDGSQRPLAILDEWFEKTVRPCMGVNCFLVRFADDFVMGFANKTTAEKVYRVLPKRFERYGLKIHPEKSRLVQFSRPFGRQGKGPGTFAFLGFDHYWGKTLNGGWAIKRKTQGKRLRRFLSEIHEWCRKNRHLSIVEQHQTLKSKLRGHYQYYGVRGNFKMLEVAFEHTERVWKRWLGRRSSKHRLNWEQWMVRWQAVCPLPKPRIVHEF